MKLAPHLHRIGNDIVAAYLVDLPEGITLIDAGLPGHWHDLQRELAEIGRPLSDVRGLVLTHGDSDHIGFAERLRREAGVPVFIHAADAHRVRTGEKPKTAMGPARLGPTLGFFAYGLRKNALRTPHVSEVTEVSDGQVLDLPGECPGIPITTGAPGRSSTCPSDTSVTSETWGVRSAFLRRP
nr:MBL fold metallo-hydrolase [Microbacterium barkeri]